MATSKSQPQFDTAAAEETIKHIQAMNERLIASSKSAGNVALDAYEKALQSMLDFQEKVAGASQLDWVSALASTHAQFIQDISGAYTKAARDTLK